MNLAPGSIHPPDRTAPLRVPPRHELSTRDAKAQLLSWAHQHDGRTSRARASLPAIATGGALAFLLGLALTWKRQPARPVTESASTLRRVGRGITAWAFLARFIPWHHVAAAITAPRLSPAAKGTPTPHATPRSTPVPNPAPPVR